MLEHRKYINQFKNQSNIVMSGTSFSHDDIVMASEAKGQALKYLPHWPPVNISFEDVVYTVENGIESK